jgi:predicted NAD-dependent protein-ADP-ribosyltransferase YbiA (DUF1768 family)
MEALNKVFALIVSSGLSEKIVGIFSNLEEARKEIEGKERKDSTFYIQERYVNTTDEPSCEIEIKYCVKGEKSEMIVTRNASEYIS